jgi:hypothetical protein
VAIAILYEFRGMTQEHYERLLAETYDGGHMPGVIAHAAGPLEGGWWAFDVYESQDAADKIGPPAIERLRAMGVEEPTTRVLDVHNTHSL